MLNRPHSITADAEISAGGAEGVLLCQGSNAGGWTFYVKDGRLCYAHNYVGRATYQVSTRDALPAVTTPMVFNPGGLTCAANPGSPITAD